MRGEDEFHKQIRQLNAESYEKGAKNTCKALIEVFRAIALKDGPVPQTFDSRQIIGILKSAKNGIKVSPAQEENVILQP
tara:strand:+ start:404 stop:640 length:237 start_codon:yes stop_codon:yes gene_type:complete